MSLSNWTSIFSLVRFSQNSQLALGRIQLVLGVRDGELSASSCSDLTSPWPPVVSLL